MESKSTWTDSHCSYFRFETDESSYLKTDSEWSSLNYKQYHTYCTLHFALNIVREEKYITYTIIENKICQFVLDSF